MDAPLHSVIIEDSSSESSAENTERDILLGYLQEITRCGNCITSKIESLDRGENVSKYSAFASLVLSIILDIIPVFIPETSEPWYNVITTTTSLITFVIGVYWERSDFGAERQNYFHSQEQFNSVKSSIQRYLADPRSKDSQEYIKRMNEKISSLKLMVRIPESR